MNYEEEAKNIVNMCSEHITRKGNTSLKTLYNLVAKALCKASGKPEHEFKLGDRVVMGDDNGVVVKNHHWTCSVCWEDGTRSDSLHDRLSPDPAYKHTLQFIEHDDGNACPISEYDEIIYLHNDGHFSWYDNAKHVPWKNIKLYAVVPKEWNK